MEGLGIDFSEIFLSKDGEMVFKNITNQIEIENKSSCDKKYVDIVFAVAFLTYIGLDDTNKIYLLGDIPKNIDIESIQKIHKKSISKIQEYIKDTNKNNRT